jgi:hypothetical protein
MDTLKMKTLTLLFVTASMLFACTSTKNTDDNKQEPKSIGSMVANTKLDTIPVLDIIEMNIKPDEILDGGPYKKVKSQIVTSYNDTNKDTIFATVKVSGMLHHSAIPNAPAPKPYEEINNWKFYKVNNEWKVTKLN